MKNKKLLLTLGGVATLAIPMATLLSCGSGAGTPKFAGNHVPKVKTSSYANSINDVMGGSIDVAGGFSDIRKMATKSTDAYNQVAPIGVEAKRISNDGIQVRGNMKPGDEWNLQQLFIKLINDHSSDAPMITIKGKKVSVFKVYSHSDYKATNPGKGGEINYIKHGKSAHKSPYSGQAPNSKGELKLFAKHAPKTVPAQEKGKQDYSMFKTAKGEKINIVFIPSNSPTNVNAASAALKKFLNDNGINVNVTVSQSYNSAATSLNDNIIDVAFLPTDTWAQIAPKSNFILQAARPLQVAVLDTSDKTAAIPKSTIANPTLVAKANGAFGQLEAQNLPTSGTGIDTWAKTPNTGMTLEREAFAAAYKAKINPLYDFAHKAIAYRAANALTNHDAYKVTNYESFLYAKKTSTIYKEVSKVWNKTGWKLPWSDVTNIKYGYTSSTSSASYIYPEMWFLNHFH